MKFYIIISIVLFILIPFRSYSQLELPTYDDVLPPSPTAHSLGKFGNADVGLHTGTAQLSIPLYSFKTVSIRATPYCIY